MKGRILDYLSIEAAAELRTKKVVVQGPVTAIEQIP